METPKKPNPTLDQPYARYTDAATYPGICATGIPDLLRERAICTDARVDEIDDQLIRIIDGILAENQRHAAEEAKKAADPAYRAQCEERERAWYRRNVRRFDER